MRSISHKDNNRGGGCFGSPWRPAGKRERWGDLESPYPPHTEPGESCCFSLAVRENRWRRCQRGLGEGDGRLCHPTAKEKRSLASWQHVAHRAVPQPAERRPLCSRGDVQRASLCRWPQKPEEHCLLIIN